jgi:hypothetical protein
MSNTIIFAVRNSMIGLARVSDAIRENIEHIQYKRRGCFKLGNEKECIGDIKENWEVHLFIERNYSKGGEEGPRMR